MSYVLTIRTRDTKRPSRFTFSSIEVGKASPTEFQIVFEDRVLALDAYNEAKIRRKPGDEIELMNHELIGSV